MSEKPEPTEQPIEPRPEKLRTVQIEGTPETASSGAAIFVLEGTEAGKRFRLGDRATIGRLEESDLVLHSNSVSKRHAVVTCEEGGYFIEDLESTNGIRVNGSRLEPGERRRLAHGDRIVLSDHLLMFCELRSGGGGHFLSTIHIDREKVDSDVEEFLGRAPEVRKPRGDGGDR